jgi:hypothetical protein
VRARNGSRIVAVGSTASSSAAAASAIGSAAASAAPVLAPVTTPSVSAPTTTDPRSKRRRQIAVRLRTDHVSDELLDVIYAFGALNCPSVSGVMELNVTFGVADASSSTVGGGGGLGGGGGAKSGVASTKQTSAARGKGAAKSGRVAITL